MKKIIILTAILSLFTAGFLTAASAVDDDETPREFNVKGVAGGVNSTIEDKGNTTDAVLKEKIIQTGALEKVENDKYTLRKVQTRLEFYIPEEVKIYMKNDGSAANLSDRLYLDIRGPKNKKAILAKSVYVYENKKMFEEITDKDALPDKKSFQAPLTGVLTKKPENQDGNVAQKYSFMMKSDDGTEYLVCFDEETLWVSNSTASKSDIIAGDRMKLFFDKRLSIRYKNYPVKIIIDKSKNVF